MFKIIKAAVGLHNTMLLTENGDVYLSGADHSGDPVLTFFSKIPSVSNIVDLNIGATCSLLLREDGKIFWEGINPTNDMDRTKEKDGPFPVFMELKLPFPAPSVTESTSVFRGPDGKFFPKKNMDFCELPNKGIVKVHDGFYSRRFFVDDAKNIWAHGRNSQGALGVGVGGRGNIIEDAKRVNVGQIKKISDGMDHVMFLKRDGSVWASGDNTYSQLGNSLHLSVSSPMRVMDGVKDVATGANHTVFLKKDGSVLTIGANFSGQLGDGTTLHRQTPVEIAEDVRFICARGDEILLVKNNNTIWVAGKNSNGQLGDGTKKAIIGLKEVFLQD